MAHVALIACSSQKLEHPAPALDLYQGALFKKSRAYAERRGVDAIFILSAKHGLVPAKQVIAPYNETLNEKGAREIQAWADRVRRQLAAVADLQRDHFTILAGEKYRRGLVQHLSRFEVPLLGLKIGEQLQRLDELCSR